MSGYNILNEPIYPSLKNLTNFGSVPKLNNEFLASLGAPHIESFNFAVGEGLRRSVKDLDPVEFELPNGEYITISVKNLEVWQPRLSEVLAIGSKTKQVYPTEARQSGSSYLGKLIGNLSFTVGSKEFTIEKDFGDVPIMIKSSKCNLWHLNPRELIEKGEHENEWGGYFISQGHERIVRMLISTRRNYPLTIKRSSWKTKGNLFSDLGVLIRCSTNDHTTSNNVLHYITDGTIRFMFMLKRIQYFVPVIIIIKALIDVSDHHILKQIMHGEENNQYLKGCIHSMLQIPHHYNINTHQDAKNFLGKSFRVKLQELPEKWTDSQICDYVLKRCVLIHLTRNEDKFNLLVLMIQKLWGAVQGRVSIEGVDSPMTQEVLMGGHLWLQYLKERTQRLLYTLRMVLTKQCLATPGFTVTENVLKSASKKSGGVGKFMNHFVGTGSINSTSSLGLMQDKGLTVTAENINNMRYMSHFRAVHRGSFFQEMRTTEARQLLPEAWGFICPVHTPDGAPCGLLNHLSKYCQISPEPDAKQVAQIPTLLVSMGLVPLDSLLTSTLKRQHFYVVLLDGLVLGHVADEEIKTFVQQLRMLKIEGKKVPQTMEIGFIPKVTGECVQFPGLFLFTGPSRFMRPVLNLSCKRIELIGTLEQLYMDISVNSKEIIPEVTTHQEISSTSFLSNLACLIPMPDCNQSPRNMYQCQMGKQTMGTASYVLQLQTEAKMYRLQTPASPLFRPVHYDYIGLDNFAMGTNAIVAVISYTGYDMEDAMVINKSAWQRGFAHGSVYKSEIIILPTKDSYFGLDPQNKTNIDIRDCLDLNGMPYVGTRLKTGQPFCSYYDDGTGQFVVKNWKGREEAYIDAVRLCHQMGQDMRTGVVLLIRIPRNPNIGDKFASRAGQKGICSMLWPAEDLPFTEGGLVPDIVFNPHGFPSRMTIAMMIEVMAGKSGAVHGLVHDATPFRFDENQTAIDYFGRLLEEGGFNYYGTEKMYSGVSGEEMSAEIFFGVVHYQRLRHMVADKWQVRSTGAVDALTQQPVKGRRRGGGVRFGEMERDSLLSHGAAFLLQDRLFHCSDRCSAFVCRNCGNILSPLQYIIHQGQHRVTKKICRLCQENGKVEEMDIPYIYRFLAMQLASVNINLKLQVGRK